ncbi:Hsp20/alpha crystallin family protein [Coriobacteriales bacterium OH1046]|nr:Hsp20/alpha crystallin family protein [Coriobacteriales bacterium OH1046]
MAGITRYNNYDRSFIRPFEMLDEIFSALPIGTLATASVGTFKMNVEDTGTSYAVTAELPGVTREQIDVELNEGNLSITINKKEVEEEKGKNYLLKETGEWTATRSIYLKDAAIEGLSAKLEDGVLSINVPKVEAKVNVTKVNID